MFSYNIFIFSTLNTGLKVFSAVHTLLCRLRDNYNFRNKILSRTYASH